MTFLLSDAEFEVMVAEAEAREAELWSILEDEDALAGARQEGTLLHGVVAEPVTVWWMHSRTAK